MHIKCSLRVVRTDGVSTSQSETVHSGGSSCETPQMIGTITWNADQGHHETSDKWLASRLWKPLLLRAALILSIAPSRFCSEVAYDILRQFGAPKASPGTMATCAFSSKYLQKDSKRGQVRCRKILLMVHT